MILRTLAVAAAAAVCAAPAAGADIINFSSPSGNIGCMMFDGSVRCDVADRDWSPPPRPTDCPSVTGYGQGISLEAYGSARFVCAGDTVLGDWTPLPYGEFRADGGLSCNSEPTGIRCSNSDRHGFTISRQSYELF